MSVRASERQSVERGAPKQHKAIPDPKAFSELVNDWRDLGTDDKSIAAAAFFLGAMDIQLWAKGPITQTAAALMLSISIEFAKELQ